MNDLKNGAAGVEKQQIEMEQLESVPVISIGNSTIAPRRSISEIASIARQTARDLAELKEVCLSLTSAADWEWMGKDGKKPYLKDSGCERIAALVGIRITDLKLFHTEITDAAGTFHLFTAQAVFHLGHQELPMTGSCNSRDQFFSNDKGRTRDQDEIDLSDIQNTAFTNMHGRGVRAILGLNNLTAEEVTGALLKSPTGDGAPKVQQVKDKEPIPFGHDPIREKVEKGIPLTKAEMLKDMARMLGEMGRTSAERESILYEVTTFVGTDKKTRPGVKDLAPMSRWSEKSVRVNWDKLRKTYRDYQDQ